MIEDDDLGDILVNDRWTANGEQTLQRKLLKLPKDLGTEHTIQEAVDFLL